MEPLTQTSPSPALPTQMPQAMPQNSTLDLKDIHLPEQISEFPIAMGWWILMALIIFCIIYTVFKYRAHLKQRMNQQQAIKQLQQYPNIEDTIKILKWAAMQYFPRKQIANLYGECFQLFLSKKLPDSQQAHFEALSTPAFNSLYQQDSAPADATKNANKELHQASLLWLKNALPPNTKLNLGAEQ